jgi:hypothetical protein
MQKSLAGGSAWKLSSQVVVGGVLLIQIKRRKSSLPTIVWAAKELTEVCGLKVGKATEME